MSRLRPRKAARLLYDLLRRHPWLPSLALFRAVELHALLDAPLESPLLDLGCGAGLTSAAYYSHRQFAQVVGLELDVQQATRANQTGLFAGCVAADAGCLSLAPASLASVLSVCVIEHIPHQERVLAEVGRILRPGGTFVFTTVTEDFLNNMAEVRRLRRAGRAAELAAYIEATNRRLDHAHYRSLAEWECMLDRAGFDLVGSRRVVSPPVAGLWSRLDDFCTRPVQGREFYVFMRRGRFKRLLWKHVAAPLLVAFLLPWVLADGAPAAGSVLLLTARKRGA